jgi:curli production assembly/transport component CsgG
MVSTSNGKILKSVYISKQYFLKLDQSLFKYVSFKRLLEVETGYTTNEPVQMAVTEAIEKAVSTLVLEGIKMGFGKQTFLSQK